MSKELPSGAEGQIEKRLSWAEYLGDNGEIAITAYQIYSKRIRDGISGNAIDDWFTAKKLVRDRFVEEYLEGQAPSLRRVSTSGIIPAIT